MRDAGFSRSSFHNVTTPCQVIARRAPCRSSSEPSPNALELAASDRVDIALSRFRLTELLAGSIDLSTQHQAPMNEPDNILRLTVPVSLKRVGREIRMLVENSDDQMAADPSLLRIIARAHDIQARLIQNTKLSVHDIAREEHVSAAYLYTLLRLPWLAPDITTAILNGRKPPQLTAKTLMRLTPRLPTDWAEQRTLLGFH
jgi:site-specific DNA recombinase